MVVFTAYPPKLDPEDLPGALRALEDYLYKLQENADFEIAQLKKKVEALESAQTGG